MVYRNMRKIVLALVVAGTVSFVGSPNQIPTPSAQGCLLGATINGNWNGNVLTGTAKSETINGDLGSDVVSGNDNDDQLFGDEGNDILNGNNGEDDVYGGDGYDVCTGGTGNDTFSITCEVTN